MRLSTVMGLIRRVLDERRSHSAPAARFRNELEDYMSEDYADETLKTIVSWGRYGEAVVLGVDGISDFEALCSRKHDAEVQLYAYVRALDGEDLRRLPLSMRKANLDRLSARRPEGIFVAPFEQGEIGPDLFRAACKMGLEGLVSKRRDRAYRGGRCTHWIKVKNPASLAMNRAAEIDWSR
jgi:ATP-dependent DNA ligase